MEQGEQPSSETERDDFGALSSLTDAKEVAPAIVGLLGNLFNDHEPQDQDGRRIVFVFGADITRGGTGITEIDETLRETYLTFDDRPRAEWRVEVDFDAIADLARVLVGSRVRPDTQVVGPSSLEMLVRDETKHSALLAPEGTATVYKVPTPKGTCTVTVGPPSVSLLLRLGLRRSGMERLSVFDSERMFAHLIEQERHRGLAEGAVTRISAQRLLRVTAEPRLRSLRLDGPPGLDLDDLERVATAFRVRLAYESDVVLAPVLDIDRLKGSSQPRLIRQLALRAEEFVEAIGQGTATGFMADRLLGHAQEVQEELSQRYLRAIAATDPFAAFMGYYQVLEYSMEEEWFQSLRKRVEAAGGVLSRPTGDIRAAATEAAQFLVEKTKTLNFRELRALQAVLDSHLDVRGLAADLDRQHGALDYFATGTVPFTQVPQLDFAGARSPEPGRRGRAPGQCREADLQGPVCHHPQQGIRRPLQPLHRRTHPRARGAARQNRRGAPAVSGRHAPVTRHAVPLAVAADGAYRRCRFHGPVIASKMPGFWMLPKSVFPSGEKVTPANSLYSGSSSVPTFRSLRAMG